MGVNRDGSRAISLLRGEAQVILYRDGSIHLSGPAHLKPNALARLCREDLRERIKELDAKRAACVDALGRLEEQYP